MLFVNKSTTIFAGFYNFPGFHLLVLLLSSVVILIYQLWSWYFLLPFALPIRDAHQSSFSFSSVINKCFIEGSRDNTDGVIPQAPSSLQNHVFHHVRHSAGLEEKTSCYRMLNTNNNRSMAHVPFLKLDSSIVFTALWRLQKLLLLQQNGQCLAISNPLPPRKPVKVPYYNNHHSSLSAWESWEAKILLPPESSSVITSIWYRWHISGHRHAFDDIYIEYV